jgi:anti-sigma28 factor (negative regulator of flagellin synthesis)
MNVWTPQGAPGGAPQTDSHPDDRPLSREDQVALELGFPPASGLSWRRRRVHQLRERVELGTYEIEPGQVAEALLARLREAS